MIKKNTTYRLITAGSLFGLLFVFSCKSKQIQNVPSIYTKPTVKKEKKCPVCKKSNRVIPIIYGKPSKEIFEKAQKGEIYLGGCVVYPHRPTHFCKRDNKSF